VGQDRDQWRVVANTAKKLSGAIKGGEYFDWFFLCLTKYHTVKAYG
jgi:hypothetical protein